MTSNIRISLSDLFRLARPLIVYFIVGITVNLLLYGVYLLLSHFIDPKLSMTLAYGIGVAIGYFSHKKITFLHEGDYLKTLYRFLIAHGIGYLINLMSLHFFVTIIGFRHQLVQAVSILVIAIYLFIIFKYWVFSGISKNADNQNSIQ
jgi:putative flippase GtrA